MAKQLFISNEALSDLQDIWEFIAEDSQINADRFIDQLYSKCIDLTKLDGVGRHRNDLLKDMMSLPYKKYIIFFRRSNKKIEIVRILRGSRDIQSIIY